MEIGSSEEGEGFEKDVKTSIYFTLSTSLTSEYQVKTRLKLQEECCNYISICNFPREVAVLYFFMLCELR